MRSVMKCLIMAVLLSGCAKHDSLTGPAQKSGQLLYSITFNNTVFTDVAVALGNQDTEATQIIPSGSSGTFRFSNYPGTIIYAAYTYGVNNQGNQVGLSISWSDSEDFSSGPSQSVNLVTGPDVFFLRIMNTGRYPLSPIYVNYGSQAQTQDNVMILNDGTTYKVGYYDAYWNTEVLADWEGGGGSTVWVEGTQFTFSSTNDQSITLLNNLPTCSRRSIIPTAITAKRDSANRPNRVRRNGVGEDIYSRIVIGLASPRSRARYMKLDVKETINAPTVPRVDAIAMDPDLHSTTPIHPGTK